MKSLFKNFVNSKSAIKLRNFLNYRPVIYNLTNINSNASVSDAFLWRTDNNFRTIFKFTDILKLFYNIDKSEVKIIFYDKNNNFLKQINFDEIYHSNSLLIEKKFFDGIEDFGVFNVFHKSKSKINSIISNRCYMGFSKNNNLFSFVHGNTYVNSEGIDNSNPASGIIGTSYTKNNKYYLQNNFNDVERTELFFCNPSINAITFSVNNKNYNLNQGCSKIIDVTQSKRVEIISNCYFLRPLVFSYCGNFFDVFHG